MAWVSELICLATGHSQGNLNHNWFDRSTERSGNLALALVSVDCKVIRYKVVTRFEAKDKQTTCAYIIVTANQRS